MLVLNYLCSKDLFFLIKMMPFVILFENVPTVSVYNINNNNFKE